MFEDHPQCRGLRHPRTTIMEVVVAAVDTDVIE
jgi:hypothetical protein